ncbi:LEC14B-like protein [Dichanthelium oligosanthes]|uniref:LEC14B-like protein n=1 Tax=Dichanthelium oligosanthes TaxID=888268 RepID=A0A1E5W549_9POAL|nr:LEC14B-like protein [Dichanthelium oligosanthes]
MANEVFHLTRARSEVCHRTRGAASARRRRPFSTFELVSARESGRTGGAGFASADRAYVGSRHIPTKGPWGVDEVDSEAYVSQFSADGSLLVAGFRVGDLITSQAYASLSPIVHIVNVQSSSKESHANVNEIHEGLDFTGDEHEDDDFGIFSVKFSKDGKEVVIGNSERSIYVYDLAANKVSVRIRAHTMCCINSLFFVISFLFHCFSKADVNAVTFADESGNVLYSGSDDSLCKVSIVWIFPFLLYVWDRRCLVGGKPAARARGTYTQDPVTILYIFMTCLLKSGTLFGYPVYISIILTIEYQMPTITGKTIERLCWHGSIIRDCTWHPYNPTLVTSSWDGYLARWEASGDNDDPTMLAADERRRSPYIRMYEDPFTM